MMCSKLYAVRRDNKAQNKKVREHYKYLGTVSAKQVPGDGGKCRLHGKAKPIIKLTNTCNYQNHHNVTCNRIQCMRGQ